MLPRQAGIKSGIEIIESGTLYYYLPDLDFGPKRSVFVPFFGVPAATVTGLAYIARTTGAAVVPCVTRMLPGGGGYVARLYPAWSDFPSGDDHADARRMMAFIEERVLEMPEQYFWLHKRFKTRPAGRGEVLLKLAVIGAGHMGRYHAEKFARLPGVELAAVVDPDPARAQGFGLPQESWTSVEAAVIAVPTNLHHEVARACLERGLHVLVEKPIAATLERGR